MWLGRALFVLTYGLLPLWAGIAVIIYNDTGRNSEYWASAPWFIMFSMVLCGVTLLVVSATLYVSRWRGAAVGLLAFVGMNGACLLAFLGVVKYNERVTLERRNEVVRLREFIEANPVVIQAVGPNAKMGGVIRRGEGRLPVKYEASVKGTRTVYAIVDVSRSTKPPRFIIACLVETEMGQRSSFDDPCKR
jgi:hypothetical protein